MAKYKNFFGRFNLPSVISQEKLKNKMKSKTLQNEQSQNFKKEE